VLKKTAKEETTGSGTVVVGVERDGQREGGVEEETSSTAASSDVLKAKCLRQPKESLPANLAPWLETFLVSQLTIKVTFS